MSIKKSNKKANKVLKAVKKCLKDFDKASIMSYGTKLNATDGCSNQIWIRVDLGSS